ncbi:hypothetical protein HBH25_10450 [Pseudomonas sp. hsmgli-8]|uniref:Uncharacterized protein n=1 Tax=Pseudomonas quercus TaxID=2722792 RepID=A0ABX0YE17_9PSED|nr:TAL effector repeat-containing protein [Pseudomonas quercus]NJP01281.1 hypothetical protein [Pseudomonas quercus]
MNEWIQRHNPQDKQQSSGASVSTQSMVFSQAGSANVSAGVPGPSRTRATHTDTHTVRHSPYPAASARSATSARSANTSSQALSTADHKKIQKAAGNATLNYVIQHLDELQHALGGREQVIKIAAHHGGQQALQALLDKGPALRQAGFSNDNLVKVAANIGGAQALQALLDKGPALRQAGFSADNLVRIAANNGGQQALQALLDKGPALRQAGFGNDNLVRIGGNGGAKKTLDTLLQVYPQLTQGGVSHDEILALATKQRGASGALQSKLGELTAAGR